MAILNPTVEWIRRQLEQLPGLPVGRPKTPRERRLVFIGCIVLIAGFGIMAFLNTRQDAYLEQLNDCLAQHEAAATRVFRELDKVTVGSSPDVTAMRNAIAAGRKHAGVAASRLEQLKVPWSGDLRKLHRTVLDGFAQDDALYKELDAAAAALPSGAPLSAPDHTTFTDRIQQVRQRMQAAGAEVQQQLDLIDYHRHAGG